jgi:hypothetical protein
MSTFASPHLGCLTRRAGTGTHNGTGIDESRSDGELNAILPYFACSVLLQYRTAAPGNTTSFNQRKYG